jgi:hypothetical protein
LHADEQSSDEPRAIRDGDSRHVRELRSRFCESGAHDMPDVAKMIARRELRHDAPVPGVDVRLGVHDVGEDPRFGVDERGAGFVARGLEP